jgi:DNA primase
MMWDRASIQQLKESHKITQIAERLGLVVSHSRSKCIHPHNHSHGDQNPSMSFDDSKGLYKCWVCPEVRGDVFSLIQQVNQCGFKEALEWLSGGALPDFKPDHHANNKQIQHKPIFGHSHAPITHDSWTEDHEELRRLVVLSFLKKCEPIHSGEALWLKQRGIPEEVWSHQKLRSVKHYQRISEEMLHEFSLEQLEKVGLFNSAGHLRFFKHTLIFPYFNQQNHVVYFQARAIDSSVEPKELNLRGPIPCFYNHHKLQADTKVVYLCEGVVDCLTLLKTRFDIGETAIAIPGVHGFKKEWTQSLIGKKVWLALDHDKAGLAAMKHISELLHQAQIEFDLVPIPEGLDINAWLGRQKKA